MKYIKYLLGAALACAVVVGVSIPTLSQLQSRSQVIGTALTDSAEIIQNEISERLELSEIGGTEHVAVREDSRKAAVRVITPYGRGSGTYFKVGGYHIVVTAQHVVDDNPVVIIEGRNGETVYGEPIIRGIQTDVAIVLIPEMNSRTPLKYRTMPAPRNADRMVGRRVTYTGFPASHDLMTIDGQIAGYENGHVIIHSYGWPGSSGSGVFDMRGRLIGVVSAVDVGRWNWMIPPQLVEDIVWVAPVWDIKQADIAAFLRARGER